MYKRKYNYDERFFKGFSSFLEVLHKRSVNEYLSTYAKSDTTAEQKVNLSKINNFVGYLEDYIVSLTALGFITAENINDVLGEVKKIKSISVLPKNQRGIYGLTTRDYKIEINPNLKSSNTLTSEERTLLYVSHEVGHIIHKMWTEDLEEYLKYSTYNSNIKDLVLKTSMNNRYCALDGLSLIDEATTQETAEMVVYHMKKGKRPPKMYYKSAKMYNGEPYASNFDYYKELEEPAVLFGRTLRGIGTSKDTPDSEIMTSLAKRAFNKNFTWDIIREYQETKELEQDFFNTLICLGRIKDASYGMFGHAALADSNHLSGKYLSNLKYFCKKNEDYRPKEKKI